MKFLRAAVLTVVLPLAIVCRAAGGDAAAVEPVTPNASPEVRALLQVLHDLSGHYTLTGQHNYPNTRSRNSEFAARYIGKTPAIFASDWGFAKTGDTDSYLARPDIVQEAIRQHQRGSLVAMCWHAVPPTADEPVTFRPLPGSDPNKLASVQGKLTDEQFKDLLTPGTPLYEHWCAQVDVIAGFLKQLQDAHVPVLWRPYHEMNGDWFWWAGRRGDRGTTVLYRQLFDRLANHHQLNNLVWVWSVDRPSKPERQFADFFPGRDYFDIAALDVYHSDFSQSYYDTLRHLAGRKPVALAEVGPPPTLDVLEKQPRWTWWMLWAEMVKTGPEENRAMRTLVDSPRSLSLEDPEYIQGIAQIRAASGLMPLPGSPFKK